MPTEPDPELAAIALSALRYAAAAAAQGSFSEAARACGVTQPTVSIAISHLEERLGGPLFARTTRRLALTPLGERLLPLIRGVVAAASELSDEATRFHNPQTKLIRVGFSPLFSSHRLYRLLEPFRANWPDVEIVYKECNVGDMEARLDTHTIDFIVSPFVARSSRRRSQAVLREPLHYLPRGGITPELALKRRHGIQLETIAGELLIFTKGDCGLAPATRELFRARRLRPREYQGEALSYSVLQEWAELGIGAAIIPASRVDGDPSRFPAVMNGSEPAQITYRAAWNREGIAAAHLQAFVRYLKVQVPRLVCGQDLRSVV